MWSCVQRRGPILGKALSVHAPASMKREGRGRGTPGRLLKTTVRPVLLPWLRQRCGCGYECVIACMFVNLCAQTCTRGCYFPNSCPGRDTSLKHGKLNPRAGLPNPFSLPPASFSLLFSCPFLSSYHSTQLPLPPSVCSHRMGKMRSRRQCHRTQFSSSKCTSTGSPSFRPSLPSSPLSWAWSQTPPLLYVTCATARREHDVLVRISKRAATCVVWM